MNKRMIVHLDGRDREAVLEAIQPHRPLFLTPGKSWIVAMLPEQMVKDLRSVGYNVTEDIQYDPEQVPLGELVEHDC